MADKEIDPEQVPDALEAYKKQIDSLRADIEVIVACSNVDLIGQARQRAETGQTQSAWANPPAVDEEFREKCRRFVERYNKVPISRTA